MEVEIVLEPEGMENTKITRPSESARSLHIMNSQRLRQHAQGLHGSAPDGGLEVKGEMDTCPH